LDLLNSRRGDGAERKRACSACRWITRKSLRDRYLDLYYDWPDRKSVWTAFHQVFACSAVRRQAVLRYAVKRQRRHRCAVSAGNSLAYAVAEQVDRGRYMRLRANSDVGDLQIAPAFGARFLPDEFRIPAARDFRAGATRAFELHGAWVPHVVSGRDLGAPEDGRRGSGGDPQPDWAADSKFVGV